MTPAPPAPIPPSRDGETDPGWARRLARQWRHRQWLKVVGTCAFTALFFIAYFHLLRHPRTAPTALPLIWVDHLIPYTSLALWPYLSLWIYVGVAPAFLPSTAAAVRYGLWAAALCSTGLACFWLWPTTLPAGWVPGDTTGSPGMALIQGLDAPGNACPSMHVASAVFSAVWIDRLLRAHGAPSGLRAVNTAWVLAIVWSTVALRQHVAIDAIAGTALALGFARVSSRWGPDLGGRVREL